MQTLMTTLLATSLGLTSEQTRMRNLEHRVISLEHSQHGCCKINPPARPFTPDARGWTLAVDPLIWQATADGLATAIEIPAEDWPFDAEGSGRVCHPHFGWDFGVRIGVGLNHLHDGWDTLLQWTHFRSSAQRSVDVGSGEAVAVTQGHPAITPATALSSSSYYTLTYNLLDLVNGRQFYVSKCMTLRPFAGVRSAWIGQNLSFCYPDSQTAQRDRTFGFGIRGGLDIQWGLGNHFALFSNYAGNLLYSYHSILNEQTTAGGLHVNNDYHIAMAIHDMQLGLRYDWLSRNHCYHFGCDLGWEMHFHPGQNQMLHFADGTMVGKFFSGQSDLGTHGLYASVRLDF